MSLCAASQSMFPRAHPCQQVCLRNKAFANLQSLPVSELRSKLQLNIPLGCFLPVLRVRRMVPCFVTWILPVSAYLLRSVLRRSQGILQARTEYMSWDTTIALVLAFGITIKCSFKPYSSCGSSFPKTRFEVRSCWEGYNLLRGCLSTSAHQSWALWKKRHLLGHSFSSSYENQKIVCWRACLGGATSSFHRPSEHIPWIPGNWDVRHHLSSMLRDR